MNNTMSTRETNEMSERNEAHKPQRTPRTNGMQRHWVSITRAVKQCWRAVGSRAARCIGREDHPRREDESPAAGFAGHSGNGRPKRGRRPTGGWSAAVILTLWTGLLTPMMAQAIVLVANDTEGRSGNEKWFGAQRFVTGSNTAGYILTSVELDLHNTAAGKNTVVRIREETNAPTVPGAVIATLTNPSSFTSSALNTFTAPANTRLKSRTGYWLTVNEGQTETLVSNRMRFYITNSDDETGAAGWSIDNSRLSRGDESMPYTAATDQELAVLMMKMNGTVNAVPTATDSAVRTPESTTYTFRASDFNFADTDSGDTLTEVTLTTWPAKGTLTQSGNPLSAADLDPTLEITRGQLDGGVFAFTPVSGESGNNYATFMFKVNDGLAKSETTYTMTINVDKAPNRAPRASHSTVRTPDNSTYTFQASDFNFSDSNSGDTLAQISMTTWPAKGTITQSGNALAADDLDPTLEITRAELDAGEFTFTPVPGETGNNYASFMFKVNDGLTNSAGAYTMTINVGEAFNSAPVVANPIPNQYARVGQMFSYTVKDRTFSDIDDDVLTYRAVWDANPESTHGADLPAWLHFNRATRRFSGNPRGGDVDSLAVKVEASDGEYEARDVFYLEVRGASRATAPLVSNLDQGWRLGTRSARQKLVQRFTTGSNTGGYTLESVDVGRHEAPRRNIWTDDRNARLSVCPVGSGTGICRPLRPPSSTTRWADTMRFTVDGTMMLAASTSYDLELVGTNGLRPWVSATQVGSLDIDSAPGWRLRASSNGTTIRVAVQGTANNPAAMPTSADTSIEVAQGQSQSITSGEFPFTASSGGGTLWGVEITSVPERERSNRARFKRGRLAFDGQEIATPFTITKVALDAGRLVYTVPDDDAVGTNYDWFQFRVREGSQVSMASYRMNIDVVASIMQEAPEPATIDVTPRVSGAGADAQWSESETVAVGVTFSEAVDVDTSSGTPSIGIGLGGTAARNATYTSGTGTMELAFQYTLVAGDGSHDFMAVTPDSLALNGGTIQSTESAVDALLAHNGALVSGRTGKNPEPETPLTASFTQSPAAHGGSGTFVLHLEFSHEPKRFGYRTVRDSLFDVEGGHIETARRLKKGRNLRWEMTIVPEGDGTVTLTARATTDCASAGATCDADGRRFAGGLSLTVSGPENEEPAPVVPDPITATWSNVPDEHDGTEPFDLQLAFSANPKGFSYRGIAASVVDIHGGSIDRAWRRQKGSSQYWGVKVTPSGTGNVTVSVNATTDCAAHHAVCTAEGGMLNGGAQAHIQGPALLSVSDAEVEEAEGATLDFAVTMSRSRDTTVTVSYATADGTATAGADYNAESGTLTFAAGETNKTIAVSVIDDAHDEGSETMRLTLSNPTGAKLVDAEATGTITNTDAMPRAWMVRFGRTVGSQVVDAMNARLDGAGGSHVTIAGVNLAGESGAEPTIEDDNPFGLPAWAKNSEREADAQTMTADDILLQSAFQLSSGAQGPGTGPAFTAWGRVATAGFEAEEDSVTMDGKVTTGLVGFDAEWERALAGVMVSKSEGDGSYRLDPAKGDDAGTVESSLTGVYPYARINLNSKVSAWALAGAGSGELTLHQDGEKTMRTDISTRMGAVGVRGQVLNGTGPSGVGVNVKSDAMWVRTKSEDTRRACPDRGRRHTPAPRPPRGAGLQDRQRWNVHPEC